MGKVEWKNVEFGDIKFLINSSNFQERVLTNSLTIYEIQKVSNGNSIQLFPLFRR